MVKQRFRIKDMSILDQANRPSGGLSRPSKNKYKATLIGRSPYFYVFKFLFNLPDAKNCEEKAFLFAVAEDKDKQKAFDLAVEKYDKLWKKSLDCLSSKMMKLANELD